MSHAPYDQQPDPYDLNQQPDQNPYQQNPYLPDPYSEDLYQNEPRTAGPYNIPDPSLASSPYTAAEPKTPYTDNAYEAIANKERINKLISEIVEQSSNKDLSGVPRLHQKVAEVSKPVTNNWLRLIAPLAFVVCPILLILYTTGVFSLIIGFIQHGANNPVGGGAIGDYQAKWEVTETPTLILESYTSDDLRDLAPIVVQKGNEGIVEITGSSTNSNGNTLFQDLPVTLEKSVITVGINVNYRGQITVTVPSNANIRITTQKSAITVNGIRGQMVLTSRNSDVTLNDCTVQGPSYLESYSGYVKLNNTTQDGPVKIVSK